MKSEAPDSKACGMVSPPPYPDTKKTGMSHLPRRSFISSSPSNRPGRSSPRSGLPSARLELGHFFLAGMSVAVGLGGGIAGLYVGRLRFSPNSEVAEITEAYRNLLYITGRWGTVVSKGEEGVGRKLVNGMLGGPLAGSQEHCQPHPTSQKQNMAMTQVGSRPHAHAFLGLLGGNVIGTAAGEGMGFPAHLAGSALLGVGVPWAALAHLGAGKICATIVLSGVIPGPVTGATLASKLGDKHPPPGASKNSRFSSGLAPILQPGLSASATLHFS